jgi:hypothetical protein
MRLVIDFVETKIVTIPFSTFLVSDRKWLFAEKTRYKLFYVV